MSTEKKKFDAPVLISPAEASHMTSISKMHLLTMSAAGQFVPAIQIGERRKAFQREAVMGWISEKIAAATAAQART